MDELERRIARYEWLTSQERWHIKRRIRVACAFPFRAKTWKWHRSQEKWYRLARKAVNLTDLMVYVFRKHRGKMAENIAANNDLLSRLRAPR